MRSRPLIALPGRFSVSASALRFSALANARALLDAVYQAGGDPVTVLPGPASADEVAERLLAYDGILMPGGADIDPTLYGQETGPTTEPPDLVQDAFDVAVLRHALDHGVPLLTVCRGTQLLNVALGGTLEQDMARAHQHTEETVTVTSALAALGPVDLARTLPQGPFPVSCYHHQRIARLAPGLEAVAFSTDGTVEAVRAPSATGWLLGVQWHPEDTAAQDGDQQRLLRTFVDACRPSAKVTSASNRAERAGS